MSYLGRSVDAISNVEKLDNITFNGGATYALTKSSAAFTPAGKNNILISVSGVVQQGNFSVSGSNIVFDSAVAGTETCDFIMHYGTGLITTPADDTVSTAKIQNDAVTKDKTNLITDSNGASVEAKGSSGYQGAVRYNCENNSHYTELKSAAHGSYSGNLSFTLPSSTGTNGQFLQTNGSGVLSFADAGGGGLEFITKNTISSSTNTIEFTGLNSTNGGSFRVIYNRLQTDTSGGVNLRFQVGDSSNYRTESAGQGVYHASHSYNQLDSSSGSYPGNEWERSTSFRFCDSIGNNTSGEIGGYLDFWGLADSSTNKWVTFGFAHKRAAGGFYVKTGGGWINTDAAMTKLKFTTSSGNYTGGEFIIYRYKES